MLAQPRGFCAGVVRAIEIVERALEVHGRAGLRAARDRAQPARRRGSASARRHLRRGSRRGPAGSVADLQRARRRAPRSCTTTPAPRAARDRRDLPARHEGPPAGAALRARRTRAHHRSATRDILEVAGTLGQIDGPGARALDGGRSRSSSTSRDPDQLGVCDADDAQLDDTREVIDALAGGSRTSQDPGWTTSATRRRTGRTR